MTDTPILDQFHRALYKALMDTIQSRVERLTKGDVDNFEDYKEQVGYIKALNHALDLAQDIESDMYGKKPGE